MKKKKLSLIIFLFILTSSTLLVFLNAQSSKFADFQGAGHTGCHDNNPAYKSVGGYFDIILSSGNTVETNEVFTITLTIRNFTESSTDDLSLGFPDGTPGRGDNALWQTDGGSFNTTQYDAVSLNGTGDSPSYDFTINAPTSTGSYTLVADAIHDEPEGGGGNEIIFVTANITLTVGVADNSAPSVVVTAPSNNTYVKGSIVLITATANDGAGVGVDQVWAEITNSTGYNETVTMSGTEPTYSSTWDSTSVYDGAYNITLKANDTASPSNLNNTEWITINVDNTAPSIAIDSVLPNPSNGITTIIASNSSSDINNFGIRANITDPSSGYIHTDLIYQGSNQWKGNFTVSQNGNYDVNINATDLAGNTAKAGPSIILADVDDPTIIITSPDPSDVFNASAPAFSVSISDTNLDKKWYTIDSGATNNTFTGSSGKVNQSQWNALPDGSITLMFYANDTAGNKNSNSVNINKDTTDPVISITTPTLNQLIGSDSPTYSLSITESNPNQVWYTLDGGTTNSTPSGAISGTIDQTLWDAKFNGTVTITFYANDTVGNFGTNSQTVRKDIEDPVISITTPINNKLIGGDAPTYSLAITEPNPYQVWYSLDGGNTNSTHTGTTGGTIDQTMWNAKSTGTVTITFYADDTVGNVGTNSRTIRKDIESPTLWMYVTPNPSNGVTNINAYNSTEILSGSILANISLPAGGFIYRTLTYQSSNQWTGSFDVSSYTDGSFTVSINGTDLVGNTGYNSTSIIGDITLPNITITSPTEGQSLGGAISIIGKANGTGSNIVSIVINNTIWGDASENPQIDTATGSLSGDFTFNNKSAITPGSYWVNITITDDAGNVNSSVRYFIVTAGDPTPPSLNIFVSANPSNGFTQINITSNEALQSAPLLNITLPNSSVVYRVLFSIDTLKWTTNWTVDANGIYTIDVNGTDVADNVGYGTLQFEGDITDPSISITIPITSQFVGGDAPTYSLTITEPNPYQVWYSLDGGLTNSTHTGATSGTIDQTMWGLRPNGSLTITFYADDSAGNVGTNFVTIWKDIVDPIISITTPITSQFVGGDAPTYSLSITESNPYQVWYSLDGGLTNSTHTGETSGTIDQTMWGLRPNGSLTITFYADDTAGNVGTNFVTIWKDIVDPIISITTPITSQFIGGDAPTYSLSITESNPYQVWYSLDGGITNSTHSGSISGTIDQTMWNAKLNGTITITFYTDDLSGNVGTKSVIFWKDIVDPSISITTPAPSQFTGGDAPTYSLSITEPNPYQVWYSLDGGTTNSTHSGSINGTIDQTMWNAKLNGTVTITFYADDLSGNVGTKFAIIWKDIDPPIIIINLPLISQIFSENPPSYNLTINAPDLNLMWYTLDGGITNSSFISNTGIINRTLWDFVPIGNFMLRFYANDTLGNLGFNDINGKKVDTQGPTLSALIESEEPIELGDSITIQITAFDLSNVSSVQIAIENTKHNMLSVGDNAYQYQWSPSDAEMLTYTIFANDSIGNLNFIIDSILVQDKTPPSYSDLTESQDMVSLGENIIISLNAMDISGIKQIVILFEGTNYTMVSGAGDTWSYTITPPEIVGIYYYIVYIEDNNNNINAIEGSFTIGEDGGSSNGGGDGSISNATIPIMSGIIGILGLANIIIGYKKFKKRV